MHRGYWPSRLLTPGLLTVNHIVTVAVSQQWVSIYSILTPSFSSFSNWESHPETNFPTTAAGDGLSENVSSHSSTTILEIIQFYPDCPSTKYCQRKQVPFSNVFLVKQKMRKARWNTHSLLQCPFSQMHDLGFFSFRTEIKSFLSFAPRRVLGEDPAAHIGPEKPVISTPTCPVFCPLV